MEHYHSYGHELLVFQEMTDEPVSRLLLVNSLAKCCLPLFDAIFPVIGLVHLCCALFGVLRVDHISAA